MKTGDILILGGIALVVAGVLTKYGLMGWFGNLPLDFKSEGENVRFYAPIGSMLLISVVASIVLRVVRYFS